MFDHIFIPVMSAAEDTDGPVDLGQLVEAMLFYERVSLATNSVVPLALLRAWGANGLLTLVDEGFLVLVAVEKPSVVLNLHQGTPAEFYRPGLATISNKNRKVTPMLELVLDTEAFKPYCSGINDARRIAANVRRLSSSYSLDEDVDERMAADFRDSEYIKNAVLTVLREIAPGYNPSPDVDFALQEVADKQFRLRTNVDFVAAAAAYATGAPRTHQTLNPSVLLATIIGTREALEAAGQLDAELAGSPLSSALMQGRITNSLARRVESAEQIELFARLTLEQGNAVREAVNSGQRTFEEIIKLLRKARTFRAWLKNAPPNAELAQHYYSSLRSGSWIERLPAKTLRWAVFTGLGALAGPLGALGGSVVDSFLLDRIVKGWKPSQFVDGPLRAFASRP